MDPTIDVINELILKANDNPEPDYATLALVHAILWQSTQINLRAAEIIIAISDGDPKIPPSSSPEDKLHRYYFTDDEFQELIGCAAKGGWKQ